MIELECPNCGGAMEPDAEGKTAICLYCKGKAIINESRVISTSKSPAERISNYRRIADKAYDAENFKDAYTYYSKILELNADDPVVHIRRGITAVCCSMEEDVRDMEFRSELNYAIFIQKDEEQKKLYLKTQDEEINKLWKYITEKYSIKHEPYIEEDEVLKDMRQWLNYIKVIDVFLAYITDKTLLYQIAGSIVEYCENISDVTFESKNEYGFMIAFFKDVPIDKTPFNMMRDKCKIILRDVNLTDEVYNMQSELPLTAEVKTLQAELEEYQKEYTEKERIFLSQNPNIKLYRYVYLFLWLLGPILFGSLMILVLSVPIIHEIMRLLEFLSIKVGLFNLYSDFQQSLIMFEIEIYPEISKSCIYALVLAVIAALIIIAVYFSDKNKYIRKKYPEDLQDLAKKIRYLGERTQR